MGRPRSLTSEQEAKAVERYLHGESAADIANDLNVNRMTICNTLRRYEVPQTRHVLSDDEKQKIVDACHRSDPKIADIAAEFDVSVSTVASILRERRKAGDVIVLPHGKRRIRSLNESVFDELTPSSIYWTGFIFGDGCLHQDNWGQPILAVNLSDMDREHLVLLRSFLGSTHTIGYVPPRTTSKGINSGPIATYRVRSQRIYDKLTEYGIVTKRTRMPIPELIKNIDLWRGLIDADGWIGSNYSDDSRRGRYVYPSIGVSGQVPVLEAFRDFFASQGFSRLEITPTTKAKRCWKIDTTGPVVRDMIALLYENAGVALARKQKRAEMIINNEIIRFPPYIERPARVSRWYPSVQGDET